MSKKLLPALVSALLFAACAKIVVTPINAPNGSPKLKREGLFYALPKTVIRVQLKVDKTTKEDAPFSKFAAIFAPDGERVCKPGECTLARGEDLARKIEVAVQQGATFSTFGEPDPSQIYLVELVGRGAVDQALNLAWNEAGLLSAASSTVTNRSTDIAVSGIKLVAGLGTKAGLAGPQTIISNNVCPERSDQDLWIIPILDAAAANTKETLISNYCVIDKVERDKFSKTLDSDSLKRALQIYSAQVEDFITSRNAILSGNTNILDPTPLINKLDGIIEQKLKAVFLGTVKIVTWDGSLDLREIASADIKRPLEILKVVPEKGIAVPDALLAPGSKPIPTALIATPGRGSLPVSVELDYYPDESKQLFHHVRTALEAPEGDRSFRYRLPAQVQASLKFDGETLGRGVLSVAQLGHVVSLPAKRNSRALTYDLTMIEATGGLKGFKLSSTGAVDAATIDALSTAGGTILDARNAARKAEETAEDELTKLTRQQTLLKLKDEICTIQRKYGLECTIQP